MNGLFYRWARSFSLFLNVQLSICGILIIGMVLCVIRCWPWVSHFLSDRRSVAGYCTVLFPKGAKDP